MKLNEMVFVIESWKGITETNSLMTLDDTIEMLKQSGEYSMKETAAIFSELGRTMTEPDWAEVYLAGNKTLFMCYCRDESHLRAFLNKKFNDENVEDVRFDYERCSLECKEKIRLYGIAENGEKDKMVEHHYSHMEHQFKQGENLHNYSHRIAVPMAGMDAGTVQTDGGVYLPGRIDAVGVIPSTTGKVFKQRHTIWGARGISGNILASEGQGTRKVAIPIKNGTKQGYMLAHEGDSINYSFMSSKERRGRVGVQVAQTLDTACNQGIFVQVTDELCVYAIWYERYQSYIAIRKLTPKECFRLQGWSWKCGDDRYFERAEFVNSDSQLYHEAGNGVTVPVVEAIAERLS